MDMPESKTFLADVEAAGEEGSDLDGCHAMEGISLSVPSSSSLCKLATPKIDLPHVVFMKHLC